MTGAERHVCRSAFGECYLLTAKQYHTRVPAGGISALAYGIIHYIQTRPTRKTSAIAARCNNSPPPKPTKNFPQEHPPKTKRNKSSQCKGGCSWGKFGVGQGGLEGRERPFQGVSLRLQGLPLLLPELQRRFSGGLLEALEKIRTALVPALPDDLVHGNFFPQ